MKELDLKTCKHVLASLIYLFKSLIIYLIVLVNTIAWDRCWRLWLIARENRHVQTLLEQLRSIAATHILVSRVRVVNGPTSSGPKPARTRKYKSEPEN